MDAIEQSVAEIDTEVGALLEPFRAKAKRLMTIPGISDVVAQCSSLRSASTCRDFPPPDDTGASCLGCRALRVRLSICTVSPDQEPPRPRESHYGSILGSDYCGRNDRKKSASRFVKRLSDLGFTVEIKEAAQGEFLLGHYQCPRRFEIDLKKRSGPFQSWEGPLFRGSSISHRTRFYAGPTRDVRRLIAAVPGTSAVRTCS